MRRDEERLLGLRAVGVPRGMLPLARTRAPTRTALTPIACQFSNPRGGRKPYGSAAKFATKLTARAPAA